MAQTITRGNGLLEAWLARQRAARANQLIPDNLREGRILDIGCGSSPYFLSHTYFREKFAVDQLTPNGASSEIQWYALDLNAIDRLPFSDEFFSVVTMLAVVEHLDPRGLVTVFREINRVLVPGGMVFITTPAAWADRILRWMARLNLVSQEEIKEHVFCYTLPLLGWYFGSAGFAMVDVHFGYFELYLNLWAAAYKSINFTSAT